MSRGGSPGFERIHVGGVWGSTQTPTDIIYWSAKVTLIGVGFSQPLTPVVGGGAIQRSFLSSLFHGATYSILKKDVIRFPAKQDNLDTPSPTLSASDHWTA